MKRGGCKFGGSKTGAVLCPKRGAVVSQLVPKPKESEAPPPPPGFGYNVRGGGDLVYQRVPTEVRQKRGCVAVTTKHSLKRGSGEGGVLSSLLDSHGKLSSSVTPEYNIK